MPEDFPTKGHWPEYADQQQQTSPKHYALSGKIMLASIITLFVVVVLLVLLHLYARRHLLRRNPAPRPRSNPTNRSNRLVYYINGNRESCSPAAAGGLDASVLKSLPAFVYSPETLTDANVPECAVCLSEFEDGEKGRVLPNCKHRFHTGCIDVWFFSNSTCPLCRSPVEPAVSTEITGLSEPGSSTSPGSPVNNETTSLENRRKRVDVRIDVVGPNGNHETVVENELRLPSPGSRLRSLKRLISMTRKSPAVSPSSGGVSTESDLESGSQEASPRGTPR
ncbi:hypothetical protein SSX86_022037 [Deinandra increscens subsp. villosa]|uniref:RING-type E3 ubiquitin transferase n=1 Tax=Deinandra increscens subsp. villosa TaxID=3103831 RepID=A0AAP0CSF9_9ASTR